MFKNKASNYRSKIQVASPPYLVSGENDGDVLADPDEVSVPVGNVLVRHTGCHIEHNDGTLTLKRKAIKRFILFNICVLYIIKITNQKSLTWM